MNIRALILPGVCGLLSFCNFNFTRVEVAAQFSVTQPFKFFIAEKSSDGGRWKLPELSPEYNGCAT